MTLEDLIRVASEKPLRAEDVEAVAKTLGVTAGELHDRFAKSVAQRYLRGELSYTTGDAAMNGLFEYSISGGGPELSQLARQVFAAFDEGEYLQAGEPIDQQGEVTTRTLLRAIAELRDV